MKITKSILIEKNRQELLSKEKKETPKRVQKASSYSVSNITIDSSAFLNDWLVITTNISGNSHTYTDSIAFKNVMTDLINLAKIDSKHYVNSKLIIRSIKRSLDNNDIYVDCNCPDFNFRYAYHATQGKFKWGKLQNSNGKKIRNPNNDIGSTCKHLYALLRSNNFLDKISDKIMRTIMANLDILVKRFDIDLAEFIVNSERYDRLLKSTLGRTKTGQFAKKDDSTDNVNVTISNKEENIQLESIETDENNLESILEYYTNLQILKLLKEKISEDQYLLFIRKYGKENKDSLEDYIINNISENKLLDNIKDFNNQIWNSLVNEMINNIF